MNGQFERGSGVFGIDGRRLGKVADVRDDALQIALADGDVWLYTNAVWTVDASGLTLICDERGVRRYEVAVSS